MRNTLYVEESLIHESMPRLLGDDWRDWLSYAEDDRREAHIAFERGSWREACFHAQQACEKLLKAYLIKRGIFIPTYDLGILSDEVARYVKEVKELISELKQLTKHYFTARYPNSARKLGVRYDENVASRCIQIMEKLWNMLRGRVLC